MNDECSDLQVYETINAPLNQLLMQIEKDEIQQIMGKDLKLICLNAMIDNITERIDEVGDWEMYIISSDLDMFQVVD